MNIHLLHGCMYAYKKVQFNCLSHRATSSKLYNKFFGHLSKFVYILHNNHFFDNTRRMKRKKREKNNFNVVDGSPADVCWFVFTTFLFFFFRSNHYVKIVNSGWCLTYQLFAKCYDSLEITHVRSHRDVNMSVLAVWLIFLWFVFFFLSHSNTHADHPPGV